MFGSIIPINLRCEYLGNPLGLDMTQPRFSWMLGSSERGEYQSAYQILVASNKEKIDQNDGDKWDTGKVESDKSVNVVYEGKNLESGSTYYWKVQCWDKDKRVSAYSVPATFEMGLLKKSDWQGNWIGANTSIFAPLLRKEFKIVKKVKRARVYISGLGWNELYINGKKVGNHVLDPAMTDYRKRILYVTHDVTDLLVEGLNAMGVILGNGWYSETIPDTSRAFGNSPRLLMQMNIKFADGMVASIKSDKTWKASTGPISRNNIAGGETYDARLEKPGWIKASYDDSSWANAEIKESPGGKLESQLMPAIRVNKTIRPLKLTNPKPGVYVYDFGQLFGGWVKLYVKGPRDTEITIKYSSRILPSGLIDETPYPGDEETDFYTLKGDPEGEVYEPKFTFHPVQYVQIMGYPSVLKRSDLEGRVIHSAVDLSGDFHCSNPLLNRIHQNVIWSLKNALKGFPLDCLHREPIAYNEPASVSSILYTRKYMPLFWTKWLNDIKNTQDQNGWISDWAPNFPGVHRQADASQSGNYPLLVWYLYQYYGDKRILAEHYSAIKAWTDYLASYIIADDHIVIAGWLGDHMVPGKSPGEEQWRSTETPPPLIWTGYYYRNASIVSQAAKIIGKTDDAENYFHLAENIKDAFNKKWLNKDTNNYAMGSQTSNLLPLILGIVPRANEDALVRNIVKNIMEKHNGHLHTGHIGTTCMVEALAKHGRGSDMYKVATTTTYPGWGYMVRQGATTIWEAWGRFQPSNPRKRADSMMMWGCIDEFFYNDLAGIKGPDYHGPGYMTPGFRQIHIKPHILGDLENVKASIKTVRGMICSTWKRKDDSLTLEVSLPCNSQAKVSVPKMGLENIVIEEGGKTVWKDGSYVGGVAGITDGSESANYVTFDVGSGSYFFKLTGAAQRPLK